MNNHDITIRLEQPHEQRTVEMLVREAFWNVYRPGCLEHYVLHLLRSDPAFIPELNLVLVRDGRIIGQTVFVRAELRTDVGPLSIAAMGPICIHPEFQRTGLGKRLLDDALARAAALGIGAVCFEGNIDFYGTCGFTYAREFGIRYHELPEGADDSFFLCRELCPGYLRGVTGEYAPPAIYLVDEQAAEAFDQSFPLREKKRLPCQIF